MIVTELSVPKMWQYCEFIGLSYCVCVCVCVCGCVIVFVCQCVYVSLCLYANNKTINVCEEMRGDLFAGVKQSQHGLCV